MLERGVACCPSILAEEESIKSQNVTRKMGRGRQEQIQTEEEKLSNLPASILVWGNALQTRRCPGCRGIGDTIAQSVQFQA